MEFLCRCALLIVCSIFSNAPHEQPCHCLPLMLNASLLLPTPNAKRVVAFLSDAQAGGRAVPRHPR
eukprot:4544530-Pyramimonas_sp.AAC.1